MTVRPKEKRAGGASGLHPTLRRSAKDGAPEALGLVKGGKAKAGGAGDLHPTPLPQPASWPGTPFAKARRMGYPRF
jgi:hypothetical protein